MNDQSKLPINLYIAANLRRKNLDDLDKTAKIQSVKEIEDIRNRLHQYLQ